MPSPACFSRASTSITAARTLAAIWSISGGLKPCTLMLRKPPLDVAEQRFVPLDLQLRVHAALQQNLVAAQGDGLLDLPVQLLGSNDVSVRSPSFRENAQKRQPLVQMLV